MTPVTLPLITSCPAAALEGTFGDVNNPTIQIQMDALSGQVYWLPLSVDAAKSMMKILANWPPLLDALGNQSINPPRRPQ
jgi:hypothetical protein